MQLGFLSQSEKPVQAAIEVGGRSQEYPAGTYVLGASCAWKVGPPCGQIPNGQTLPRRNLASVSTRLLSTRLLKLAMACCGSVAGLPTADAIPEQPCRKKDKELFWCCILPRGVTGQFRWSHLVIRHHRSYDERIAYGSQGWLGQAMMRSFQGYHLNWLRLEDDGVTAHYIVLYFHHHQNLAHNS